MKKTLISSLTIADAEPLEIDHAIAEVDREMQVRCRIYDGWVQQGKLAYIDARDRYLRLLKALTTLQKIAAMQEQGTSGEPGLSAGNLAIDSGVDQ